MKQIQIATEKGKLTVHTLGAQGDWVAIWPNPLSTVASIAHFALMLSDHHRVLVFEPPGIGQNAHLPYTNELNTWAYYAHRALSHLGIQRCHWVGQAAGGVIGAALHTSASGRIESLTLVTTPMLSQARIKTHLTPAISLLAAHKFGRKVLAARLVSEMGCLDESEEARVSQALSAFLESVPPKTIAELRPIDGASVRRVFDRLRQNPPPTLVIAGEFDRLVLARDQRTVAELTLAHFAQVAAGHMVLLTEPDTCAHIFLRFMEHLRRPGSRPTPLSANT